jgi:hypothetical protein
MQPACDTLVRPETRPDSVRFPRPFGRNLVPFWSVCRSHASRLGTGRRALPSAGDVQDLRSFLPKRARAMQASAVVAVRARSGWSAPPRDQQADRRGRAPLLPIPGARRNHLRQVRKPTCSRRPVVQAGVRGRLLTPDPSRPGRRRGHLGDRGGSSVHVRDLHAPSFGPVHGLRQKKSPAVPAATSRSALMVDRCGATAATVRTTGGLALHCALTATTTPVTWCGSGTPRAVAPVHDHPAARRGLLLRAVGQGVPGAVQGLLLKGGGVPGTGLIHLPVPIRLDGPQGPDGPARIFRWAPGTSRTRSRPRPRRCGWTRELCGTAACTGRGGRARSITDVASRDGVRAARLVARRR